MRPKDVRLPRPFTFFIDRCLGTEDVPTAVAGGHLAGESLHIHDDLFVQDTDDEEWLTLVGNKQWVGLTKDDAIRRRPSQIAAIIAANSAVFIFGTAGANGAHIGEGFRVALPRIRKALLRFAPAIIGRVTRDGGVSVLWHEGQQLEKAVVIK